MPPLTPPEDSRAPRAPSVVILGNDAQLAARPATPVQLAHACLAAGYRAVVPASWGDELVAGATLAALRDRETRPSIHCACPHVARRVLAAGSELAPHLISLVAPPVAAARYLRLHSDEGLRIAYVGRCPAAADDSIDARLTPEELLAQLADRGIDVASQPEVFESVIPPDRRRHLSLPGGLPAPETLWSRSRVTVETMKTGDFASELADLVLARSDSLIDAAPLVGCACSGVVRGVAPSEARVSVAALEPPRSALPVIDDDGALSLELRLPAFARDSADLVAEHGVPRNAPPMPTTPAGALGESPPPPPAAPNRRPRLTPPGIAAIAATPSASPPSALAPRRRSPVGTPRVIPGAVPVSSDSEGRVLPRAYVARRRSPRAGVPIVNDSSLDAAAPTLAATPPARSVPRHTVPESHPADATRAVESERPVVRSVEPAAAPTLPPNAASVAAAVAPAPEPVAAPVAASEGSTVAAPVAVPGESPAVTAVPPRSGKIRPPEIAATVGRGVAALRQRSWLVIACAIAGTGLLLGAAIGYALAHRGAATASTPDASDRGIAAGAESTRPSGVRESVSAGGIAPVPNVPRPATRRPLLRNPERAIAGRQRQPVAPAPSATSTGSTPPQASPAPSTAALPAPLTPAPIDSSRVVARRDSIARAESLVAERDAIRREIGIRRARMDSVERLRRRIDSLQRVQLPPPPDR